MEYPKGLLFEDKIQKELKEKFYYIDAYPVYGERLFFERARRDGRGFLAILEA